MVLRSQVIASVTSRGQQLMQYVVLIVFVWKKFKSKFHNNAFKIVSADVAIMLCVIIAFTFDSNCRTSLKRLT